MSPGTPSHHFMAAFVDGEARTWLNRLGPWPHNLCDLGRNELSPGFSGHEARIHVLKHYCQGVPDTASLIPRTTTFRVAAPLVGSGL